MDGVFILFPLCCILDLVTAAVQSEENSGKNYTQQKADIVVHQCKCLPGCFSIKYKAEVSQAFFDMEAYYKVHDMQYEDTHEYSRLRIFFDVSQFIASTRSELYGLTDFLANCGGLLGLCMGFSILSLAEIIYFLSLRIIIWRKRNSSQLIDVDE